MATLLIAHLNRLLEAGRRVRTGDDLESFLERLAASIAEALGFQTVVINLYRPAWDDFVVSTVHGNQAAREALLGDARPLALWEPLLDERFMRRGAYFIPAGELDWDAIEGAHYVPEVPVTGNPFGWQPEDALMIPMRHTDGRLLGILAVDEPESGFRPADADLDALVAVATHAASAVESAQEAAASARLRQELEALLSISSQITAETSIDAVLRGVCEGIRSALGFQRVAIEFLDEETSLLVARAAAGWALEDPALAAAMKLADLEPLLVQEFEVSGCYLASREQAVRLAGFDGMYASKLNGHGPFAWNRHWLIVPLRDPRSRNVTGIIWADEPEDRLIPSAEKLKALRLFANQAESACALAGQLEQMHALATHDPLTGLRNRRAFFEDLQAEVATALDSRTTFTIAVLDLDDLKAMNDSFGHQAGDEALSTIGKSVGGLLRAQDRVYRIGGDEFALLLPGVTEREAKVVVDRLRRAIERRRVAGLALGVSIGLAAFDPAQPDPDLLVQRADTDMYGAKRARRAHLPAIRKVAS
jgi:diguanylate cyclase (GGDEF)-like protein